MNRGAPRSRQCVVLQALANQLFVLFRITGRNDFSNDDPVEMNRLWSRRDLADE
jgi:hypothetical protein